MHVRQVVALVEQVAQGDVHITHVLVDESAKYPEGQELLHVELP